MMKKNAIILACFLISLTAYGQLGVNTANPNTSSDLELGSNNKALYLNRIANTAAISNPQNGMIIYDTSEGCVKAYQSNTWSGCLGLCTTGKSNSTITDDPAGKKISNNEISTPINTKTNTKKGIPQKKLHLTN